MNFPNASIAVQRDFWTEWNATTRERELGDVSEDQRRVVLHWLSKLGRTDLDLIDVGCGAGWMTPALKAFGRVTATDICEEVLNRARLRIPQVAFIAGDFAELDFGTASFDVVVSLEVLAHVPDQRAFIAKISDILRPGGHLMMATQNRPVLEKHNRIPPPQPGNLRRWVDRDELRELLSAHFEILELFSITPKAGRGAMRIVAGDKARRAMRLVAGRSIENLLEHMWLGWTLMALARKAG